MILDLLLASGLFWTLTYLLIILRGFRDKTYGMPFLALSANLSWEFIFSFVLPQPAPQVYVNRVWFALDLVILFQFLRYWQPTWSRTSIRDRHIERSFPNAVWAISCFLANRSPRFHLLLFALAFLLGFATILGISLALGDWEGKYTAYAQNLLMSFLFIVMFKARDNLEGQSFYIALFKLLGTLLPSIGFFLARPGEFLFDTFYLAIFVLDAIYLIAVYKKSRELGINPWTDLFQRKHSIQVA